MMKRLAIAVMIVATAGCAHSAVVTQSPSSAQVQTVRQITDKALIYTDTALSTIEILRSKMDSLPINTASKNDIDCGILKVFGSGPSAASAKVVEVCGPVPTSAASAFQQALDRLKTATVCPQVSSSVRAMTDAMSPFLTKLETSSDPTFAVAGASVRAAVAFMNSVLSGGVQCSQ